MRHNLTIRVKRLLSIIIISYSSVAFSQTKIVEIEHGESYNSLKGVSYYDFKDNCRSSNGWYIERKLFPYHFYNEYTPERYAWSIFPTVLLNKNRAVGNEYREALLILAKEFDNQYSYMLSDDFDKGRKSAYNYMKLYMMKFEVISEYYKERYNLSVDKGIEIKEIKDSITYITAQLHENKIKAKNRLSSDLILQNINIKRQTTLDSLINLYKSRIEGLVSEKEKELGLLSAKNYIRKKEIILEKYNPKIEFLITEAKDNIASTELFWNDKYDKRKSELAVIFNNELEKLEADAVIKKNQIRKSIVTRNNLEKSRDVIEEDYENSINSVNAKIESFISTTATKKKGRRVINSVLGI